jgi:hypothetical protein
MKKLRIMGLFVASLALLGLISSPVLAQSARKVINFNAG